MLAWTAFALGFVAPTGAKLPPAAEHQVDFARELKPLFEASCVNCHGKGKNKGSFSLETRQSFLKGGESGLAAVSGKSDDSLVVRLVAGSDPENVMPKKGTKWTPQQVGLLRAWIDQGMLWDSHISFAKPEPANLKPRAVALPSGPEGHPIDRLLAPFFRAKGIAPSPVVEDRIFARRAFLDTIGLLPSHQQLDEFLMDKSAAKRTTLVQRLLSDRRGYADHWLTFWNDLLRNDYRGTGFIDGGRSQISGWLYSSLIENKHYDRFVAELINPGMESQGFTRGIIWRGTVNASMLPPMQAAQNLAQVFMGVNLKCASCHDSFINDWTLADSYGLAAIYSDETLEMVHCDKPTGKFARMSFLYPQLGALDEKVPKAERLKQLEKVVTSPANGRIARTIVNRLWARLLGRGIVEPLDDMEKPAWNSDLLDWLAEDLVENDYDLKHTIELILTSRAYQLPAVEATPSNQGYQFRGPLTRRLTAEQFADAISELTDQWARMPATIEFDFTAGDLLGPVRMPTWIWTIEPVEVGTTRAHAQFDKREAEAAAKRAAEAAKKQQEQKQAAPEKKPAEAKPKEEDKPSSAKVEVKPWDRHKVAFRKIIILDKPAQAYAAVAASQGFSLFVNDKQAGRVLSDGQRSGRIAVFDVRPLMVAGANTFALEVTSHTEKGGLTEPELETYRASQNHLNTVSGVAFYLRAWSAAGEVIEVTSDEGWQVRRAPEDGWRKSDFDAKGWLPVIKLPAGLMPIDEGPALQPIRRKDYANEAIELGPTLRAAVSTAIQPGRIRAALLAADPLMTALDRPNREQVITSRSMASTTLQALELTNGSALDNRLKRSARTMAEAAAKDPAAWVDRIYLQLLGRKPGEAERQVALEALGQPVNAEGVADFMWALLMLPEFQLIN
jgi:mono/diheme cytochrome c family protein